LVVLLSTMGLVHAFGIPGLIAKNYEQG